MAKVKGFSLVELMIVLAVVAILAAIAYPMYQSYILRSACDSGKAGLLQADALMNQLYMQYGVYNNADIKDNKLPGMGYIPVDGSSTKADFTIAVSPLEAKKYTITATVTSYGRLRRFSGSTLTIDQSGARGGSIGGINVWTNGCSALK
ncbi:prepilin-type N-terminal cleavage/methylation domain-containing protein [Entomomonas moraniae]|uniref:Prepilin-type N-terminal cleavage/methylation domain-containing protein n=1 Tax=Entomomonas moraniae TaxID=2213226 RepID=A0A451EQK7_9GAMM|nr:type IV pilin protein [Entomomonas moraniae]AZS52129.1 prepilin-type N-terminal cleavage/methylation domain-containing protein [Entomomonas moraniae]